MTVVCPGNNALSKAKRAKNLVVLQRIPGCYIATSKGGKNFLKA